jgi:hypothetical protein
MLPLLLILCLLPLGDVQGEKKPAAAPVEDAISGRVTNRLGEPIADAKVCTATWLCTKSHPDGTYRISKTHLKGLQEMIWSSHSGFKSLLIPITDSRHGLILDTKDRTSTEWYLPKCTMPAQKEGTYIGFRLKFFVPKGTRMHDSRDVDYKMTVITMDSKDEQLVIGDGPSFWYANGFPNWIQWIKEIAIREAVYKNDSNDGPLTTDIDVKGRSEDGTFWRFTGNSFFGGEYKAVSQNTAEKFNKIIDSLCVDTRREIPFLEPIPAIRNYDLPKN